MSWKYLAETEKLKREINKELQQYSQSVSRQCGLMYKGNNEEIIREYCRHMGYIQSLEKVLKIIEEIKDDDEQD